MRIKVRKTGKILGILLILVGAIYFSNRMVVYYLSNNPYWWRFLISTVMSVIALDVLVIYPLLMSRFLKRFGKLDEIEQRNFPETCEVELNMAQSNEESYDRQDAE